MFTRVYDTPERAAVRLMELGVSLEALQRAVADGHAARITTTDHDAPFIPGTFGWSFTVRKLRDELVPLGWRKADPHNFSLVINDRRELQIVVESGDHNTRRLRAHPKTRSLKGLYAEAATIKNRIERDFFPETLTDELKRAIAILEYPTWILLIYITDEGHRAELSLPNEMEGGHIVSWRERIFIPDVADPFGGRLRGTGPDNEPEIDIVVRRRA
jgi:hypothetical protein